ncbi:MAG: tRNA glutamyl-Q(34) synthetase GluQRS [Verrucomicrobiota bacterium]|nr:tRNA glutamyl-Q(34) synthetase GluQRS [Verrucomicrobiota bacterium]
MKPYRGRIAPTPTGLLHLGHAQTFWIASQRAYQAGGQLLLRIEDLDPQRSQEEFASAAIDDLTWLGIKWSEGPDRGGPYAPYIQSKRIGLYREILRKLITTGHAYPCRCSRKDVREASAAPHDKGGEPLYPGTCRPSLGQTMMFDVKAAPQVNWRFRVPDGKTLAFKDDRFGSQSFVAGNDFGDFLLWRHDNTPSYQLAVVADDHNMEVTEIVRGADLLKCTARQLLIYDALGWSAPAFHHCPLVRDKSGKRLAKRNNAFSIRAMRESGATPDEIRSRFIE